MKKVYYLLGLSLLAASLVACTTSNERKKNNSSTTTETSRKVNASTNTESTAKQAADKQQASSLNSANSQQKVDDSTISSEDAETGASYSFTWSSIDEAINFYEHVYKNSQNKVSKDINWGNYDRNAWSLEKNQGNTMILHFRNVGGAGGSYVKFIKISATKTKLIQYDGNASNSGQSGQTLIVNNSDYKVINE